MADADNWLTPNFYTQIRTTNNLSQSAGRRSKLHLFVGNIE